LTSLLNIEPIVNKENLMLYHIVFTLPQKKETQYTINKKTIVLRLEHWSLHLLVTSLPKNCPIIEEIKKSP